MDKSIPLAPYILKKLAYHTDIQVKKETSIANDEMLKMLGFSKASPPILFEKLNYPTSFTLPSFEEELKKMVEINSQRGLKKKKILPEEEQQATD
jgi:hypothetical protein